MEKNMIGAKVIEDSVCNGDRITSFELVMPRIILAEFNTYRVFSRSASSSRAVPIDKNLDKINKAPFIPRFTKNQKGMMANEYVDDATQKKLEKIWLDMLEYNTNCCKRMSELGCSKQYANRPVETWSYVHDILTTTELDNFFEQRIHEAAQPEIRELAIKIKEARDNSIPEVKDFALHLPYVTKDERLMYNNQECLIMSVARCARVSYMNHVGNLPTFEEDHDLYTRLVGSRPIHASPSEHQAFPIGDHEMYKNFKGWVQYRYHIENMVDVLTEEDKHIAGYWSKYIPIG